MTRRLPPRARFGRPQWAVSMGAALAIIGFVGAAQWNSSLARQQFVTSAQRVLIIQAEQLQREQEQLREDIEEAEAQVRALQESQSGSAAATERLNRELREARLASGLLEVRGPGVVLEIADSPRTVPPGERGENYLVLTDDLRNIVTALWASGAEAISIAGGAALGGPDAERLVASSAIYGAGSAILVNGVQLSPPFRVEAIGPDGLHDRFLAHPSYATRVVPRIDAYGLQFASEPRDEITIPAYGGTTPLRWGAPVREED